MSLTFCMEDKSRAKYTQRIAVKQEKVMNFQIKNVFVLKYETNFA